MFLDYLALVLLIIGALLVFYTFIYIHDLPHEIAKKRNHPHSEAIHVACWLSLLTLHAIWPLVFIWSLTKQEASLIASGESQPHPATPEPQAETGLAARVRALEKRLEKYEKGEKSSE